MYIDYDENAINIRKNIGNDKNSVLKAYSYCLKTYGMLKGSNRVRRDIVSVLGLDTVRKD